MGSIEIADRFWPYHKQLSETPLSDQTFHIESVRQLFLSRWPVPATIGIESRNQAKASPKPSPNPCP